MKTELKFTFTEDDSSDKLYRLVQCDNAFMTISQVQDYLRSEYKYNDSLSEEVINYLDGLRTHILGLLEENGVDMEEAWG